MNIEIAKILDADIATAVWHENCFDLVDFNHDAEVFLTTKNFQKWMFGFLKMKFSFWRFGRKIQSHPELDSGSSLFARENFQNQKKEDCGSSPQWQKNIEKIFFLSNEASTVIWNLPKNSKKIFYAHSISRHLFDLYDDYLAKVPKIAKIPYRVMAFFLKKLYLAELKKFDIILTNSPANQKRLKEWCNIESFVLFPPVNTEKFQKISEEKRWKIFTKYKKNYHCGFNPQSSALVWENKDQKNNEIKNPSFNFAQDDKWNKKFFEKKLSKNLQKQEVQGDEDFSKRVCFSVNEQEKSDGNEEIHSFSRFYISFARVNTTKWIDKIIWAFSENPDKKLLIIFGTEDSDRENFQKMSGIKPTQEQNTIFQSEKFPNIFWLSLRENEDLPEIVANATATVCMSKNEDFGMVAIESMAAGMPVIAPDEWWYKETIIDGKTGFLLAENTSEKLSDFLKNLDEKNLENMCENCISQAQKFSLKNFRKNLEKIIYQK